MSLVYACCTFDKLKMMDTMSDLFRILGEQAHTTQGIVSLAFTLSVLYWSYAHLLPALALRKIPLAGKDPGLFGFGIIDAKRDFKKNGLKILDEGYRKVSPLYLASYPELWPLIKSSTKVSCLGYRL